MLCQKCLLDDVRCHPLAKLLRLSYSLICFFLVLDFFIISFFFGIFLFSFESHIFILLFLFIFCIIFNIITMTTTEMTINTTFILTIYFQIFTLIRFFSLLVSPGTMLLFFFAKNASQFVARCCFYLEDRF